MSNLNQKGRNLGMYFTYKAKIIADKKTKEVLNNLCFSATKLYNTVNFYLREEWESQRALCDYLDSIGYPNEGVKIPLNRSELQNRFKENPWAINLHSQSAQFVIGEVISAYKSWFALRKNGHKEAKSPGFRRKIFLSPVTLTILANLSQRSKTNCTSPAYHFETVRATLRTKGCNPYYLWGFERYPQKH